MDQIVRYADRRGLHVGLRAGESIRRIPGVTTMAELLHMSPSRLRETAESALDPVREPVRLLPPIDERTEVWGGGVTYERSLEARSEESETSYVYDKVYDAARPELFFKAPAWRVRTEGDPIAIRTDSPLNVPEPELALWIGSHGDILGYLVCNDMTSRSIEADNPLYLPQAKVYSASCAISDGVVPYWDMGNPSDLRIAMTITRGDAAIWHATTTTASLKRALDELVAWLVAEIDFPDGVILSTGTGIVPELDFVLETGDRIEIEIEDVGSLTNTVVSGRDAADGLDAATAADDVSAPA